MTLRPFRVAMRARNPCVRLRLITLGWNVRFMVGDRRTGKGSGILSSENEAVNFPMSSSVWLMEDGLLLLVGQLSAVENRVDVAWALSSVVR